MPRHTRNGILPMSDRDPSEVAALTGTFAAAELGDSVAAVELFGVLYRELHQVARRQLHANAPGMALGATTLLHEAYVSMASRGVRINDRSRFFAYAARAMRGLIIDHIREGRALKRGGEFHFTTLGTETLASVKQAAALDRLDEALSELAQADAQAVLLFAAAAGGPRGRPRGTPASRRAARLRRPSGLRAA